MTSSPLTGRMGGNEKSAPATVTTSGGRTPEENVHSHSSAAADSNAVTASHVIAGSASVERKFDGFEVRIAYRQGSCISLGSWNSPDGHGGLVVVQNPDDLLALATEIAMSRAACVTLSREAASVGPDAMLRDSSARAAALALGFCSADEWDRGECDGYDSDRAYIVAAAVLDAAATERTAEQEDHRG